MGLFSSSQLLVSIKREFSLLLLKEFPALIQCQNFSVPLIAAVKVMGAVRKRKSLVGSEKRGKPNNSSSEEALQLSVRSRTLAGLRAWGQGMPWLGSSGHGGDEEAGGTLRHPEAAFWVRQWKVL